MVFVAFRTEQVEDLGNQLLARVRAFDEKVLHPFIGVGKEHFAGRRCAIPPSTATFLIVGFDTARHFVVTDKAYVRSIDPHTKGVGGYDHIGFALHENLLRLCALLVGKSSMIADDGACKRLNRRGDGVD